MGNVANNKVDPNRAQSEAQLGKHITDIRIYHISKYMNICNIYREAI